MKTMYKISSWKLKRDVRLPQDPGGSGGTSGGGGCGGTAGCLRNIKTGDESELWSWWWRAKLWNWKMK